MFSESTIGRDTIQAFLETVYYAHTAPVVALSISKRCFNLGVVQKLRNTDCSAILTAWNPKSQVLSGTENAARHAELIQELNRRSLEYVDSIGQHPSNGWPAEEGVLVFGLAQEAAKALGTRFEQNAIVWNGPDAVPQLVLLR